MPLKTNINIYFRNYCKDHIASWKDKHKHSSNGWLIEISLVQNNFCQDHSFVIAAIKISHSSFVRNKIYFIHKFGIICYSWNTQRRHVWKDSVKIYISLTPNQFEQIETFPWCQYALDRLLLELLVRTFSLLFHCEQITWRLGCTATPLLGTSFYY